MNKFVPNYYYKDIYKINYDLLKQNNIKCLMFDLDNTLALIHEGIPEKKLIKFIEKLSKDFDIYIVSNNYRKRIEAFCSHLDAEFISFALKPLGKSFHIVKKKKNYKKSEMCVIGDQLMTDILGGNNYGCITILVDPLGKKDLKITTVNRFLENIILKRLAKKKILERGKYYE